MGFFDFEKVGERGGGKNVNLKDQVTGRRLQLCFVKRMLGDKVSDVEQQEAVNKDIKERDGIFEKLEKLDTRLKAEYPYDFIPRFDFSNTHEAILKIIDKGYEFCVFQFDSRMENYALNLLDEIREHYRELLRQQGDADKIVETDKMNEEIDRMNRMKSWMHLTELGGLINDADEQHAWWIFATLLLAGKSKDLSFKTNVGNPTQFELIFLMLGSCAKKDVDNLVSHLRAMKDRLIKNQKITKRDGEEIEKIIEEGLNHNKKIHEEYPDRP